MAVKLEQAAQSEQFINKDIVFDPVAHFAVAILRLTYGLSEALECKTS